MKVGSIVETVADFEMERIEWGLQYPKKGDVLTVSSITKHPNKQVSGKGIVLLNFEELPMLPGLCDKTIRGKDNFIELLLPDDIEEIIKNGITNEQLC